MPLHFTNNPAPDMETSSDEFEEKGKKYERRGWIEQPGANPPSSDSDDVDGMPIAMAEMEKEDDEIEDARIKQSDSETSESDSDSETSESDSELRQTAENQILRSDSESSSSEESPSSREESSWGWRLRATLSVMPSRR